MKIVAWELQEKLYSLLENNPALRAEGVQVYDKVPKQSKLPFVAFGDEEITPANTKVSTGESNTVTLHIWSKYNGRKQVKKIMDIIAAAVYAMPLTLPSGARITLLNLDAANIIEEEQESLYHGIMRFSFIIRH
jgi:hypothetical protein